MDRFDIEAEAEAKAIGRANALRSNKRNKKNCGHNRGGKSALPTGSSGSRNYGTLRLQNVA